MANAGVATYKFIDYDGQTAQLSVETVVPTAGNFAAQVGLMEDLGDAIVGITLGGTIFQELSIRELFAGTKPTIGSAQRSIQWLVHYVDDSTAGVYSVRVPCASLAIAGLLLPSSNEMDLTSTEGAIFVAAFEAVVLHDGNSVTVQKVEYLQ